MAVDDGAGEFLPAHAALQFLRGLVRRRGRQRGEAAEARRMLLIAAATKSLVSAASSIASAASNCSTPGEVSDTICMSMPAASISAMRLSPRSHSCGMSLIARALLNFSACSFRSRPGPSRNRGVAKCSSSVMVRIAYSLASASLHLSVIRGLDPLSMPNAGKPEHLTGRPHGAGSSGCVSPRSFGHVTLTFPFSPSAHSSALRSHLARSAAAS